MADLSIVVATYNGAGRLPTFLAALGRQTAPAGSFEIVVVDDGSTDASAAVVEQTEIRPVVHLMRQANGGQAAALNVGIAAVTSPYVLFLDDDVEASAGLVAEHLRLQHESGGALVAGRLTYEASDHGDWYVRRIAESWKRRDARLSARTLEPTWRDCYSGNLSVPREAVIAAGGFATGLSAGFDIALAYDLVTAATPVLYAPDASARHQERKGADALVRDSERSGAGAVEMARRRPQLRDELLATFLGPTEALTAVRRTLLALRVPPVRVLRLLGPVRRLARGADVTSFVSNYAFWHGVRSAVAGRREWVGLTSRTTILMYHAVGGPDERASRYVVPGATFSRQLRLIRLLGRRPIHLGDYVADRRAFRAPTARAVAVTIDDCFADVASEAAPRLRRARVPATVFAISDRLGRTDDWDGDGSELGGRPLATAGELRLLADQGMAIGGHTRTHPRLPELQAEMRRDEIAGGREELRRQLDVPVELFAFPYGLGASDPACLEEVTAAGYLAACGVRPGPNTLATPLLSLHRVEVHGTDSLLRVALAMLTGRSGKRR